MEKVSDEFIYEKLAQAHVIEFEPQFSLKDLEGKTIKKHEQIKYKKFREPRKNDVEHLDSLIDYDIEDPHGRYKYSPEKIDVIIFSDNTFLASEMRGNGELEQLGFYYFNGEKTLYSDRLFGV